MFSHPGLQESLSPRQTPASKKECLSFQGKLLVFIFAVLTSLCICLILVLHDSTVDSTQIQEEYSQDADELHIGEYTICSWERVPVADSVLVNGDWMNFSTPLIEGELCETGELVLLVLDANKGVHGSIGSTHVVAETSTTSTFVEENLEEVPHFEESEDLEARAEQWRHDQAKWTDAHGQPRRRLLNPGSVDIHLHLDLDAHMVSRLGSYGAAEYAVELIAVMNRDVYFPLGFNLKVTSINLRSSYVSQTKSPGAYLQVIQNEGMPENANLVHSLTTRGLGGGVAFLGGMYSPDGWGYGVSGSLHGDFHYWDLVVVAHELGHNFGGAHTHEMSPQVDNCGDVCDRGIGARQEGTIMSYCDMCQGGLSNILFVFHDRVKEDILQTYDQNAWRLPTTRECTDLTATIPNVGVPFYLKTDQCLDLPNTNPELCELDSAWVKDRQTGEFRLVSVSDRDRCWEADCGTNSVFLLSCSSSSNAQLFEFVGSQLRSVACNSAVTGGGTGVLTLGSSGSTLTQWCSPDNNPGAPDAGCENTNDGLTDPWGDDCGWYDENPDGCGQYDGNGFRSNDMCCTCGGGRALTSEPTTQTPTMASVEPTFAVCEDTANGATDSWDDDCAWYEDHTNGCGNFDDNDFSANEMCCVCGGGQPVNPTTPSPTLAVTPSPTVAVTSSPTVALPPAPTMAVTPAPTASPPQDFCYISACGCPPFNETWCDADTHYMLGWCAQSEANCLTCLGAWCPIPVTSSPTMATPSPTVATPNPTTRSPTTITTVPETTTETPTTQTPTMGPTQTPSLSPTQTPSLSPTTMSPTQTPSTETPTMAPSTEDAVMYVDVDLNGRTCHNRDQHNGDQRVGSYCRGNNGCALTDCQTYCDEDESCMFLFFNNRGNCQLYNACDRLRRPGTSGVTQQKLANTTSSSENP